MRLAGKRAIILGAAGQGNMAQSIARRFRAEGAELLVAGRHQDVLSSFADEIDGHWAICDITKEEDLKTLAKEANDKLGGVDIAVNATGWGLIKPFLENTREDLESMSALQFVGAFQFAQHMVEQMMHSSGGSLIQISSATATIMLDDHAAYMGTKAAMDHVIRCVANEFGQYGIRANSISPGITETPMTARAKAIPGYWDLYANKYPMRRTGTSQDIAAAAIFLASDECFMTGENLQVNGGLCLTGNPSKTEKLAFKAGLAKP